MMMSERHYYLAYGSNLHPLRIEDRLGSVNRIGNVTLEGWQLCFHKRGADGSGKGNLIEKQGCVAWGVLYAITEQQMQLLDQFEGAGYLKQTIQVVCAGKAYDSFCYLAEADWIDNTLLPHDWYHELIYQGARNARFSDHYIAEISRQDCLHEPDGHKRHAGILNAMRNSALSSAANAE